MHRKCIYLHEVGVLIVHGEKYDRRSVDMVVQAKHDWPLGIAMAWRKKLSTFHCLKPRYDDRSETYLITLQSAEQVLHRQNVGPVSLLISSYGICRKLFYMAACSAD